MMMMMVMMRRKYTLYMSRRKTLRSRNVVCFPA